MKRSTKVGTAKPTALAELLSRTTKPEKQQHRPAGHQAQPSDPRSSAQLRMDQAADVRGALSEIKAIGLKMKKCFL